MTRSLACLMCFVFMTSPARADDPFAPLGVHTVTYTSPRDYDNPFVDVDVTATIIRPDKSTQTVRAFWDGGRDWRIRIRCEQRGEYAVTVTTNDPQNPGTKQPLTFIHESPLAPSRLRISEDHTHFLGPAGKPWFYLADTAWNGALRSTAAEWDEYLTKRAAQKFTAVQFVTTQWRGGNKVLDQRAFEGLKNIALNPAFFERMDERFAAVASHGLVPAPVMLWALKPDDPGQALDEADALRLVQYELARWGALDVVWLLAGDGNYTGDRAARWKHIGSVAFADQPEQIVTLHPSGRMWIAAEYADQSWYDFVGYQSGHGDSDNDLKMLTQTVARDWAKFDRPVINLEPNYENHPAYQSRRPHTAQHVRRAAYWSLLVAPPAGVTYGTNPIWNWSNEKGKAEAHENLGDIAPWRTALDTEGVADMTILRTFFDSGPWQNLRPAPDLLAQQPGDADPNHFIAAARTPDGSWTVIYTPMGDPITFKQPPTRRPTWFNTRTGKSTQTPSDGPTFTPPDANDWVLQFR